MAPSFHWFDTGQFLLGNFATFRLLYNLWLDMPFGSAAPDESWRARWSLGPKVMDEWGRRGLELAGKNLDKIVEICREWKCQLTLVVYPWPTMSGQATVTASRSRTGGSGPPSAVCASLTALAHFSGSRPTPR
jgi:hypothetical protein